MDEVMEIIKQERASAQRLADHSRDEALRLIADGKYNEAALELIKATAYREAVSECHILAARLTPVEEAEE